MTKLNTAKYNMTYQEIANQLTKESNYTEVYTANSIKMICTKALKKLRLNKNIEIIRDFY